MPVVTIDSQQRNCAAAMLNSQALKMSINWDFCFAHDRQGLSYVSPTIVLIYHVKQLFYT